MYPNGNRDDSTGYVSVYLYSLDIKNNDLFRIPIKYAFYIKHCKNFNNYSYECNYLNIL